MVARYHLVTESLVTPDVCISADEPITQNYCRLRIGCWWAGGAVQVSGSRLLSRRRRRDTCPGIPGSDRGTIQAPGAAVIRSLRNDGRKWCPVDQIEYWDKCCRWRDGAERAPVHFGESGVGDQTGEFQGNGVISKWRNVNRN